MYPLNDACGSGQVIAGKEKQEEFRFWRSIGRTFTDGWRRFPVSWNTFENRWTSQLIAILANVLNCIVRRSIRLDHFAVRDQRWWTTGLFWRKETLCERSSCSIEHGRTLADRHRSWPEAILLTSARCVFAYEFVSIVAEKRNDIRIIESFTNQNAISQDTGRTTIDR